MPSLMFIELSAQEKMQEFSSEKRRGGEAKEYAQLC